MRSWGSASVIVTGATGFIGSQLVRRLAAMDATVHAVSRRDAATGDGVRWHVADLCDPEQTAALIKETKPRTVFHLASAVTGARDVALVGETVAGNLIGAVNLMTALTMEAPGSRLVLAGSVEEANALSPYAVAKAAA